MTHILGQAPNEPCPVCNLNPVGLREIAADPTFAECARCGLTYLVRDETGAPINQAFPPVSHAFLDVFRRYWKETGRKLGPPPALLDPNALDPELTERGRALDAWLADHPELVAGATAPESWPFVSVTLVVAELDGRPVFQIAQPPGGLTCQPIIPIQPTGLPIGTIVTLAIPRPGPADSTPDLRLVEPVGDDPS